MYIITGSNIADYARSGLSLIGAMYVFMMLERPRSADYIARQLNVHGLADQA